MEKGNEQDTCGSIKTRSKDLHVTDDDNDNVAVTQQNYFNNMYLCVTF